VEKNISCRVRKRSLIRTLVIKKMMKKKKERSKGYSEHIAPNASRKRWPGSRTKIKEKEKEKEKEKRSSSLLGPH
jgi:hypothetical protein